MSPSKVMQIVKSILAREFFRHYPEIKKRYFWGGKLWTQSYFVETIGDANEETIRKYVQTQLVELDKYEAKHRQLGYYKTRQLAAEFFIAESLEGLDEKEKVDRLCELNVKEQVINVCNTPVVQKVWREGGELTVHGWIYNINNGRLIDMGAVDSSDWNS